jgi:hypothetical protein
LASSATFSFFFAFEIAIVALRAVISDQFSVVSNSDSLIPISNPHSFALSGLLFKFVFYNHSVRHEPSQAKKQLDHCF